MATAMTGRDVSPYFIVGAEILFHDWLMDMALSCSALLGGATVKGMLRSRRSWREGRNECGDLLGEPIWSVDVDIVT